MAYRSLLLFFAGTAMFGSTITTSLIVRENAAPSRHASLSVSDGTSYVIVDLFRSSLAMELAVQRLGHCGSGSGVTTCDFTPGGSISAVDLNVPGSSFFPNMIVGNGAAVPQADLRDYHLDLTVNFYGSSPVHGMDLLEWGPVPIYAEVFMAVRRISEGVCVFCVTAPNGVGTASGLSSSRNLPYSNYQFSYSVAGPEAAPEPTAAVLIALGLVGMMILRALPLALLQARAQQSR